MVPGSGVLEVQALACRVAYAIHRGQGHGQVLAEFCEKPVQLRSSPQEFASWLRKESRLVCRAHKLQHFTPGQPSWLASGTFAAKTALRFSLMGQACCHGSTRVIIP